MADAFPADDPVARWLATLSIALNELIFASTKFEVAEAEADTLHFFRLSCLHLWEVTKLVSESQANVPDIKAFVDALPPEAAQALARIERVNATAEVVQIRDLSRIIR